MGNTVRGIVSAYVDGEKLWETTNTITNDGKNWLAARLHVPDVRLDLDSGQVDSVTRGSLISQHNENDLNHPGIINHTTAVNGFSNNPTYNLPGVGDQQGFFITGTRAVRARSTNTQGYVQTNNLSEQGLRSNAFLALGTSNQATSVNDTGVVSGISSAYWPNNLRHNQSSYFTSGRFQSTVANTDNATNADMEFNFQPSLANHDTLGYAIGTTVDAAGTSIGPGNTGSKTIAANATSITVATPHLFPVAVQADSSTHYFIEITDTSGGSNDGDKEIVKVTNTGTHSVSHRRPAIALTGHGLTAPKPYIRPYFTRTSEFTIVRAQQSTSAMAFPTQFDTGSLTNRGHTFKTIMHRNVHYFATTGANNVNSYALPLEGTAPNNDTEIYISEATLNFEMSADTITNPVPAGITPGSFAHLGGAGGKDSVAFSRVLFPSPVKFTKDSYLFELVWDIQFP